MITRISLIILNILILQISASAEIKLVLSSRYEIKDKNAQMILGDIATIECGTNDCAKLTNLAISRDLYSDGYVDKDEMSIIIKSSTDDLFIIYGNAVRIAEHSDTIPIETGIINNAKDIELLVKKGDFANLILIRRGISIELYGKAMNDGRLGEVISVELKLKNSSKTKLVKGKVSGRNRIESDL